MMMPKSDGPAALQYSGWFLQFASTRPRERSNVAVSSAENGVPSREGFCRPALGGDDAERLTKILRLLSSDSDGEVLSAAAAASRFLRARSLDWPDIIRVAHLPSVPDWVRHANYCLMHPFRDHSLNEWEANFCVALTRQVHRPATPLQAEILARLVAKLRTAERARAA